MKLHLLVGLFSAGITITAQGNLISADLAPDPLLQPRFSRPDVGPLPSVPSSEIRVLVFPHAAANPPQGGDSVHDRTALITSGVCRSTDPATGRQIESGPRLDFSADLLTAPRYVECDRPVRVERAGAALNYTYRGTFIVRRGTVRGTPSVEVINVLTLEDYLRGVVPIEMPSSWPSEALRAQAIAARTYAMFHIALARSESPTRGWDVDDTVQYQAYTGTSDEAAASDAAVASTAGMHLTYEGKIIQAFFSSDAGGHTENAENVWPRWGLVPYCRGKPEAFDRAILDPVRWGPWTAEFTRADLGRRLGLDDVTGMMVPASERAASGRAMNVRVQLRNPQGQNSEKTFLGTDIRRVLQLRSTLFTTSVTARGVTFTGIGHGHGAGMSQIGAKVMAENLGHSAERILAFYYSGVELVN